VKADLSRITFNRLKHFSRVVAQQGRVQLDADWNEQSSIMLYQLRRLAADVIGPAGGPADNLGFGLDLLDPAIASNAADFVIGAGHYYVDGILCEVDAAWLPVTFADTKTKVQLSDLSVDGRPLRPNQYVGLADADPASKVAPVQARIVDIDHGARVLTLTDISAFIGANPKLPRLQRVTTFLTQPEGALGNFDKGTSQIYLDVWERLVTYVEDDAIAKSPEWPDTLARTGRADWRSHHGGPLSPAEPRPVARQSRPAQGARGPRRDAIPCTTTLTPAIVATRTSSPRRDSWRETPVQPTSWSRENGVVAFPSPAPAAAPRPESFRP
jgi:hypothetical protein